MPRVPTYDITAPETISLTLPPAAVASGQRILVTPSFVIEGDAAAKATALEASSDPTARLVYAPLARCLESESKGEPLSPHVGGIVLENLRHAFGPAFGEEWGDRRIYPQ